MKQQKCVCQALVYIDENTGNKFNYNSTEYPHTCGIKIPLYMKMYGIQVRYSDGTIAQMQTDKALELKLNPFKVRFERQGDYLVLK